MSQRPLEGAGLEGAGLQETGTKGIMEWCLGDIEEIFPLSLTLPGDPFRLTGKHILLMHSSYLFNDNSSC